MPLKTWSDLKPDGWPTILIGNGSSRTVSDRFNYGTLYDRACNGPTFHPLQPTDRQLFERATTKNFEIVLAQLRHALTVADVIAAPADYRATIQEHYGRIKQSLAGAVHSVHPDFGAIGQVRLDKIGSLLLEHDHVFSTNYDLIVYWAAMSIGIASFYDYFAAGSTGPPRFRKENVRPAPTRTKLLFPHGGLHLYVPLDGPYAGMVHKRIRYDDNSILNQLYNVTDPPLIVAEGSPDDKLQAIYGSPYLTFAYRQLSEIRDPLVIFGSRLGDSDSHLLQALEPLEGRHIAVSIYGQGAVANRQMARVRDQLDRADRLEFFSAATHPLGDRSLAVGVWDI